MNFLCEEKGVLDPSDLLKYEKRTVSPEGINDSRGIEGKKGI